MASGTFYTICLIPSTSLRIICPRWAGSFSGSPDELESDGLWSAEPSPIVAIDTIATSFTVSDIDTISTKMTSRTFRAQTLTNAGHLFIWTFQRVNRSFARTVVPRRTRKACGLVKLVVKCSRLTFEFEPKSFSGDPRTASRFFF